MKIRIVDAFTDRPFAGNPAGVVVFDGPDEFPADDWLQQVAAEVNLSETAFALRLHDDPEADWALRWLTPTVEVNLCGHATLATTHVLNSIGAVDGAVRYRTRSGVLGARPNADGSITLDFPAAPITEIPAPDGLADVLGVDAVAVSDTGPLGDLLVELQDDKAVRALAPDMAGVIGLGHRGLLVTARSDDPAYHFVSRFFCPGGGVPEDPVTGSAHTALAPYWSARLGSQELVGFQASKRGGVVRTAVVGERVHLTGNAITVIEGELLA